MNSKPSVALTVSPVYRYLGWWNCRFICHIFHYSIVSVSRARTESTLSSSLQREVAFNSPQDSPEDMGTAADQETGDIALPWLYY
jgi:hypothetical protein